MKSVSLSLTSSCHVHNDSFVSLQFRLLLSSSKNTVSFPYHYKHNRTSFCAALKICNSGGGNPPSGGGYSAADLLRKPTVDVKKNDEGGKVKEEDRWVDWEDRILEDTVPLVGFVRMILHSGKYVFHCNIIFCILIVCFNSMLEID